MSENKTETMSYHPLPSFAGKSRKAYRKAENRLTLIRSACDLRGKRVLDLGCSNGYFSFEISRLASSVLVVDFDAKTIEENRDAARRYGVSNVEFRTGVISPAFIEDLPRVDVAIFLSVLHHIIMPTGVYGCNDPKASTTRYGVEILGRLCAKTKVLFFEIEEADYGFRPGWAAENLLKPAGFTGIETLGTPDLRGLAGALKKRVRGTKIEALFLGQSFGARAMRRLFSYDSRDARVIYKAVGCG